MEREEYGAHLQQMWEDLVRHAASITGNEADGCDVVQDVALNTLSALDRLKGAKALKAWLYKCVSNTAKTVRKRRLRRRDFNLPMPLEVLDPAQPDNDPDPEVALSTTNPLYVLAKLIDETTAPRRRLAIAWILSDGRAEVMARITGASPHVNRATLGKLRVWGARPLEEILPGDFSPQQRLRDAAESAMEKYHSVVEIHVDWVNRQCPGRPERRLRRVFPMPTVSHPAFPDYWVGMVLPRLLQHLCSTAGFPRESFKLAFSLHDAVLPDSGLFINPWGRDGIAEHLERRPELSVTHTAIMYFLKGSVSNKGNDLEATNWFARAWQAAKSFTASDELGEYAITRFRRAALRRIVLQLIRGQAGEREVAPLLETDR